jgi:hypothetical protein
MGCDRSPARCATCGASLLCYQRLGCFFGFAFAFGLAAPLAFTKRPRVFRPTMIDMRFLGVFLVAISALPRCACLSARGMIQRPLRLVPPLTWRELNPI